MFTLTFNNDRPLYEQLYSYVRDEIEEGRIGPGEKLPSKRALSAGAKDFPGKFSPYGKREMSRICPVCAEVDGIFLYRMDLGQDGYILFLFSQTAWNIFGIVAAARY